MDFSHLVFSTLKTYKNRILHAQSSLYSSTSETISSMTCGSLYRLLMLRFSENGK